MDELWSYVLVLGSAVLCGGLIGMEREWRGEWAGMRTHMMVAMGAATFVQAGMASTGATSADLSRILQGITAGIGFIGAGTILKLTERMEIRGLTTASSVWLAAAAGAGCGVKQFLLSFVAVGFSLVILLMLRKLEDLFPKHQGQHPSCGPKEEVQQRDAR